MRITYLIGIAATIAAFAVVPGWAQTPDFRWYERKYDASDFDGFFDISNADELAGLAQIVNGIGGPRQDDFSGKTIRLNRNISLSGYRGGDGWTPIGYDPSDPARHFRGTFDGQGNVISGLYMRNRASAGLFGRMAGSARVLNVGVEGVDIEGSDHDYIGAIVGIMSSGLIDNCHSAGSIKGRDGVGGIAGDGTGGTIRNSRSAGVVSGRNRVGGLSGSGGSVENSYSTGDVTGLLNEVGGVMGVGGRVTNSYSTGNVIGREAVGGVMGLLVSGLAQTANSYSSGDVRGENYVGGVVGRVSMGRVTNCYFSGEVTGGEGVGGIVGWIDGSVENRTDVRSCAALASRITSSTSFTGLIIGHIGYNSSLIALADNAAFAGTVLTRGGASSNDHYEAALAQGIDLVTPLSVVIDRGTVGGRFTDRVWTTRCGSLPGLRGEAAATPEHLRFDIADFGFTAPDQTYIGAPLIPRKITAEYKVARAPGLELERGVNYEHIRTIGSGNEDLPDGGIDAGAYTMEFRLTSCGNPYGVGYAEYFIRQGTGDMLSPISAEQVTYAAITIRAVKVLIEGVPAPDTVEYAIATAGDLIDGGGLDGLVWQRGTLFTGLAESTDYYVYARTAPGANYKMDPQVSDVITTRPFIPITDIIFNIPDSVYVGEDVYLSGTALPDDASHRDITWSVMVSRSTGAVIQGGTLRTSSAGMGPLTVRAVIENGSAPGADFDTSFDIRVRRKVTPEVPSGRKTGLITVRPNPARRTEGDMKFYRTGRRIASGKLVIFDAVGNIVRSIDVRKEGADVDEGRERQLYETWDFTNKNGRRVPAGIYLLKGIFRYDRGESDEVGVLIGVAE